jgi:AhpD family alkylhydroperoxidase
VIWHQVETNVTGPMRSDFSYYPSLAKLAPPEAESFDAFHSATEREDGLIPSKYRQLIALGVALTTQCPLCVENHAAKAREAGASKEELAELIMIAAAVRAGGSVTHGLLAMRAYDESKPLT